MGSAVWTVPADRMKAGREHRVPLSGAALAILRRRRNCASDARRIAPVFPGGKAGTPLSNMAMLALLRRMGRGDLTAHGFRSTFRDWCAEATNYPREVAEAALAHTLADKVEAAYRRGDLMEKRSPADGRLGRVLWPRRAGWGSGPAPCGAGVTLLTERTQCPIRQFANPVPEVTIWPVRRDPLYPKL